VFFALFVVHFRQFAERAENSDGFSAISALHVISGDTETKSPNVRN
jgi:hypothetical protein